jgi:hypothetical protein
LLLQFRAEVRLIRLNLPRGFRRAVRASTKDRSKGAFGSGLSSLVGEDDLSAAMTEGVDMLKKYQPQEAGAHDRLRGDHYRSGDWRLVARTVRTWTLVVMTLIVVGYGLAQV